MSVAANVMFQGKFYQSDVGLYYFKDPLVFGVWYRGIPFVTSQAGDAVIGMVGIKTDQLNIGLSYDFTISNLITSSGGAIRDFTYLFVHFSTGQTGARKIHAIPCPEF